MSERPALSPPAWLAAHEAAERCIPRLMARGLIEHAANLARRSKQFAERAAAPDQAPPLSDILEKKEG